MEQRRGTYTAGGERAQRFATRRRIRELTRALVQTRDAGERAKIKAERARLRELVRNESHA